MKEPGIYRQRLSMDGNFTTIPNAWIRNTGLSTTANFLLIYFMTHEVGYHITFEQIERETAIGRKGFRSALKELEAAGWLIAERTVMPNGLLGAYRYTITEPPIGPQAPVAEASVAQASVAEGADNRRQLKENNLEEDKEQESSSFDDFWTVYPLKRDKQAAERAWRKALRNTNAADIIAAARAYRDDPERKPDFTKYPATWLNAGSWLNDYTPAAEERRQRIEEELAEYRAEQKRLEALSAPPPKCPHGNNIARCLKCLHA